LVGASITPLSFSDFYLMVLLLSVELVIIADVCRLASGLHSPFRWVGHIFSKKALARKF